MRRARRGLLVGVLSAVVGGVGGAAPAGAVHALLTLELTPETSRNAQGTLHTIQATISAPSPLPQLEVHFKIIAGPNAATPIDFTQPNGTCVITAGQTQCAQPFTYQDRRSTPTDHTDTIVAWIDHDERIGREQLSLEGLDRNEIPDAGAPPHEPGLSGHANDRGEPDQTDVVLKSWGQLGASAAPLIDGLDARGSFCRGSVGRSGGVAIASVRQCAYLFALPADREEDPGRDYYAVLVQASTSVPRRGWCATSLQAIARAPVGTRLVSIAAPAAGRVRGNRILATRLPVTAGRFAFEPGLVEQTAFYPPGTLRTTRGRVAATTRWTGRSREPLGLAVAVQVSARAGAAAPRIVVAGRAPLRLARC